MTRHMEPGEIHAWLDGELEAALGSEAAGSLRRHVEACAECRRRIEEEGELRTRAAVLLGEAAPDPGPLASLEALRERARTPGSAGGTAGDRLARYRRWAWAASVVVALGVGWGLRDRVEPGRGESLPATVSAPSAAEAVALEPEEEMEQDSQASAAPEEGAAVRSAEAPARRAEEARAVGSGPEVELPAAEAAAPPEPGALPDLLALGDTAADLETSIQARGDTTRDLREVAARDRTDTAPITGIRVAAEAGARVRRTDVDQAAGVAKGRGRDSPASPLLDRRVALDEVVVTGLVPSGDTAEREIALPSAGVAGHWRGVTLTVTGMEVLSATWTEVTPGVGAVRVLHRLAPTDTLELVFFPDRPDDEAGRAARRALLGEPLRPGWSRIERVRDGVRLVARAPLSPGELARIVEGVGRRP